MNLNRIQLGLALMVLGFANVTNAHEVAGEYIVPVPSNLAAQASFPITYSASKDGEGRQLLKYKLPDELVAGQAPEIVLREVPNKTPGVLIQFESDHASASCRRFGDQLTCFVVYPGAELNLEGIDAFLGSKYTGPELEARKKVARFFSADPKGIVNYTGRRPY